MSVPLLQAQGLTKRYRRGGETIHALTDFDLQLMPGERLGLLGPNGAGKSTLLRVLTRLCEPDSGHLLFRGEPLARRHMAHVGLLLEGRSAVNERLSTWENARYLCGLREARFDAAWLLRLAAYLELPDVHAPVRQFSTGNRLRSALLMTLVHRPQLLLLDEPTLGLDVLGVERLQGLIDLAQGEGATVLISSHDLAFVEQSASRIVCIHAGRKRFDGPRSAFVPSGSGYRVRLQDLAQCLGGPVERQWQVADHAALCSLLAELTPHLPQLQQLQVQPLTLAERYRELLDQEAAP